MPKEVTRDYKFADGTLKQFADLLKINATRDAADFTPRGVTEQTITDMQTLIDGFSGIATDDELLGIVTTATEQKEASRNNLIVKLRTIRGIAEVAFGGEARYRSFGFTDMLKMNDADLCRLAVRVRRIANELEPDLLPHGYTKDMGNELQAAADDFDAKIDAQKSAINNRDIATQERIVAGNNLFAQVNKVALVGKNLYIDTNEAKYNDYILPGDSGGGEEPKPPTP